MLTDTTYNISHRIFNVHLSSFPCISLHYPTDDYILFISLVLFFPFPRWCQLYLASNFSAYCPSGANFCHLLIVSWNHFILIDLILGLSYLSTSSFFFIPLIICYPIDICWSPLGFHITSLYISGARIHCPEYFPIFPCLPCPIIITIYHCPRLFPIVFGFPL